MANRRPRGNKRHWNKTEDALTKTVERVELFEQYSKDVLPELQRLLKEGRSAEELYQRFSDQAAARAITIALTEPDSGKALQAVKEVQDRAHGKPKERAEHTHKYEKLTDQELEALMKSKIEEAGLIIEEDEDDDQDGRRTHN